MRAFTWPTRLSGFTLVEVILAILVVGVGLTASLRALPVVLKTSQASRDTLTAQHLATSLLAEISMLPFEDPVGTPVFGPDPGERTTIRADFDDIDDYNGWTASPPQKKDGSAGPGCDGYIQSVAVAYVDVSDFTSVITPGPSDAKRITVTVSKPGIPPVVLTTVRLRGVNREDGI